ncbi:MAG: hypothetical protein HS115_09090 [Spirochaetales bacterium]|nr:hypothetical protein [Spirochaetales bacterium]
MARRQAVQLGKRRLELSNLDKVLFPDDGIVKAELIDYYHRLAPIILRHIKGRPLSLVRFPDGIYGETFFQKNRPDWAPDWVESCQISDLKYMIAAEDAALVFLANLACIELHPFQSRLPHVEAPDYMIFDLDPPEGFDFSRTRDLARGLREHLQNHGYHPFIKTTGGKGLHVLCPLLPRHSYDDVFDAAKHLADLFLKKEKQATLQIKKEKRNGRVLIDVYRNRLGQTIIGPYSVRGRTGAPVSAPLLWEDLDSLTSPVEFNLRNLPERVSTKGDPWEAFAAFAVDLHTTARPGKGAGGELPVYRAKRNLEKSGEPAPDVPVSTSGLEFVLHRHHASRLHYDLRLEMDGALRSWALPRGLPPRPSVKRLAVQTEEHPLKYLEFQGTIPAGHYGAGQMWIFARGKFEILKQKKDGFYLRLSSPALSAEYRMIELNNKEWLIDRLDAPARDYLLNPPSPMLADATDVVPVGERFLYELKWDGIRAIFTLEEGQIRIFSRNGHEITESFPELLRPDDLRATTAVLDGEIVVLDDLGRPVFEKVIKRMRKSSAAKEKAVCYFFDLLYLDGRSVINDPLELRREWLADLLRDRQTMRLSEVLDDGQALFAAVKSSGLEGIVAKDRSSRYTPGERSASWLKVKVSRDCTLAVLGYTPGEGEREETFASLVVGEWTEGKYRYRGRVGSGFTQRSLTDIRSRLDTLTAKKAWFSHPDLKKVTWLKEGLFADIHYSSLTTDGLLRAPVFHRLRPDFSREECRLEREE